MTRRHSQAIAPLAGGNASALAYLPYLLLIVELEAGTGNDCITEPCDGNNDRCPSFTFNKVRLYMYSVSSERRKIQFFITSPISVFSLSSQLWRWRGGAGGVLIYFHITPPAW